MMFFYLKLILDTVSYLVLKQRGIMGYWGDLRER